MSAFISRIQGSIESYEKRGHVTPNSSLYCHVCAFLYLHIVSPICYDGYSKTYLRDEVHPSFVCLTNLGYQDVVVFLHVLFGCLDLLYQGGSGKYTD